MAKVKRFKGLDCTAPADKMLVLVLGAQLKAMCALRGQALDWEDPEGVHDMRVLSRRLRSALSDFKPYLRKPSLSSLKLRAIAKSLGAVRDEDVALAALEELKSKAKDRAAEGIEMLAEERRKQRNESRAKLEKAISRSNIKELRKEFLARLNALTTVLHSTSRSKQDKASSLTFAGLGAEVINERLKEFTAASRSVYFPFEIKKIHELRILAKRLRYAVELFSDCWGEKAEALAKDIALMQDSLGELHDCDVWIERLGVRLVQTAREDRSDEAKMQLREGATWLLAHFAKQRVEHYRDALARWHQWEADGLLTKLKMLLHKDIAPPKTSPNTNN